MGNSGATTPKPSYKLRLRVPGSITGGPIAGGPQGCTVGIEEEGYDRPIVCPSGKIGIGAGEHSLQVVQHAVKRTNGG